MLTSNKLKHFSSIALLNAIIVITLAVVPRPLGVSLLKATLYQPGPGDTWQCLDGSKILKYLQINDDYCDCPDGSDEPGTAACTNGRFHCVNRGHRSQDLPSSRVNDGVCDCCDGSDEYEDVQCSNTCDEMGRFEKEQRKSQAEMLKRGSVKRSEMVSRGRQLKVEREKRRQELEQRRQEQESLRNEKEEFKKLAETAEKEAIDYFKEQQSEREAVDAANSHTPDDTMASEASAYFIQYDTNKDGFIEVTELQIDINLDKDRNGEVTIEEAKYFLDERDRIDLDSFITLSWPRIKPMQMIAQGIFKPPLQTTTAEADNQDKTEELDDMIKEFNKKRGVEKNEEEPRMQRYPEDEEDDEETFEEDESDVGEGTVEDVNTQSTTAQPEYDPETQRLIDLANEARNTVSDIERTIREIEQEIKDIDDQNSKDYGPHDEYATLEGECYKFEDREYVYTLCPFERASQQPRSGGSETTLGRWDQWLHEGEQKYQQQKYAHGASCWNGPQRSTIVQLKCALESRITSVSEPNRCEYYFDFETPAACDEEAFNAEEKRLRDEL